jgi:hypothetical protein
MADSARNQALPTGQAFFAWAKLEEAGGTLSIEDSINVSSVNDGGSGNITVNWDTDFSTVNYACTATAGNNGEQAGMQQTDNFLVGSCKIRTYNGPGENSAREHISVLAVGS